MKLFVSVPIFLCLAGFLFLSDTMFYRVLSQNEYLCYAPQIVNLPKDVDFVVIGSSRVRVAIDPELLQEKTQTIDEAYNLAMGGSNSMRNYSWVNGILESGIRPKYIYLEIDLREFSGARTKDKWWPSGWDIMSRYTDFFDLVNVRQNSMVKTFYIVQARVIRKLDSDISLLTQGRFWKGLQAIGRSPEAPRACVPEKFNKPSPKRSRRGMKRTKKKFEKYENKSGQPFRKFKFSAERWDAQQQLYHLEKIRQLANKHEFELIVSRPWESYERPLSPKDRAMIQAVIPEFVFPPTKVVKNTWPHFLDVHHMTYEGGDIYTTWLSHEIDTRSTDNPKP